ncbi:MULTISPECIES: hypothetical protein [unclassified Okeania]|nr:MULTISPECIES: hypothetical protein [unclassified Okeania]
MNIIHALYQRRKIYGIDKLEQSMTKYSRRKKKERKRKKVLVI